MKGSIAFLFLVSGSLLVSCTGYAPYPIDEKPKVKAEENFFGIWKVVEDSNKMDYILFQSQDDVTYTVDEIRRDHGSVFSYEKKQAEMLGPEYGIDTVYAIKVLKKLEEEAKPFREYECYITRADANGMNPHYNAFGAYLSKIGDEKFLNVNYWHDTSGKNQREEGYFFVRLLRVTPDTIITTVVSDRSMRTLISSKAVRDKIQKNLNNKAFYKDTVHFYKVKGGHFGFNQSMKLAN
jgi:hypothetical protein